MRKLYKPHYRGPGDGLVFHVLFGFSGMSESDQQLVSKELPAVMDDIAELIEKGYTVILDTQGTLGKLRQALYSDVPDLPRLRTAGVMWSSPGHPDGTFDAWDGSRIEPEDIRPHRVDRLLRLVVLSASYAGRKVESWNRACGSDCHVFTWDGELAEGDKMDFFNAREGDRVALHDLIRVHLLSEAPASAPSAPVQKEVVTSASTSEAWSSPEAAAPAYDAGPEVGDDDRTIAMPAVSGPLSQPRGGHVARGGGAPAGPPRGASQPRPDAGSGLEGGGGFDDGPEAAAGGPQATAAPQAAEAGEREPETDENGDPIGSIANSVFSAISGGKSFDQVVGEQLKRHKLLGGVASTVLPGLVTYAGSKAVSKVKDTGAQRVINSATKAASDAFEQKSEEEERAEAEAEAEASAADGAGGVAASAAPPAPDDDSAPKSPREVEARLREVSDSIGARCEWQGKTLCMDVPLADRHQNVYARLLNEGGAPSLSLYCHVGYMEPATDLSEGLRLTSQTYFARVSLVPGDQGDTIMCQTTLPRAALSREVLKLAVEELAGLADGLEASLFGRDAY